MVKNLREKCTLSEKMQNLKLKRVTFDLKEKRQREKKRVDKKRVLCRGSPIPVNLYEGASTDRLRKNLVLCEKGFLRVMHKWLLKSTNEQANRLFTLLRKFAAECSPYKPDEDTVAWVLYSNGIGVDALNEGLLYDNVEAHELNQYLMEVIESNKEN